MIITSSSSTPSKSYPIAIYATGGGKTTTTYYWLNVIYGSCTGDVNNDKRIDLSDVLIVNSEKGYGVGNSGYNPNADVNQDGIISLSDVLIVNNKRGQICPLLTDFTYSPTPQAKVPSYPELSVVSFTASATGGTADPVHPYFCVQL